MGLLAGAFLLANAIIVPVDAPVTALLRVTEVTMPRNPERPMKARTCAEARQRLDEAQRGSPLISRRENERTVRRARAQLKARCG